MFFADLRVPVNSILSIWKPATAKGGLEGVTFHDLRRANATGLVAEGVDVGTAQARLGHSDPRLTLAIYAQATGDADPFSRRPHRSPLPQAQRPG
ncbi:MAG: tyrosine-type recombinase/integrase, partial [Actinobacteria bacterium]|nr:tyrosine-type recombinase/integrase [Actinomycetota bacterium]